jgi:hypothetical protein
LPEELNKNSISLSEFGIEIPKEEMEMDENGYEKEEYRNDVKEISYLVEKV